MKLVTFKMHRISKKKRRKGFSKWKQEVVGEREAYSQQYSTPKQWNKG